MLMEKINFKGIYRRTLALLLAPNTIWPRVLGETRPPKVLYRNYLIPVAVLTAACVFLSSMLHYSVWQAAGLATANLAATICGTWFAYLITREYLCGKLNYKEHFALNLTVYSSAPFILLHSIGTALGNTFPGQLLTLFSFIFIRTLYAGLEQLPRLQPQQKTNILIITSLAVICLPVIISQLLKIIFGISAFTV